MSEYEKDCYTCRYLKVDAWKPIEKDAEKTVKDWERRIFNV